jgi:hypothetical protein
MTMTAKTQIMAMTALIESNRMGQVYAAGLQPRCSRMHTQATRRRVAPVTRESTWADALCTIGQTVTVRPVRIAIRRADLIAETTMLLIVLAVVLVAVVIIPRMRVPAGNNPANLGWMSEQWLAEHRASHCR